MNLGLVKLRARLLKYDIRFSKTMSDKFDVVFVFGKSWIPEVRGETAIVFGWHMFEYHRSVQKTWQFSTRSIFSFHRQDNKVALYNSYESIEGMTNVIKYLKEFRKVSISLRKAIQFTTKYYS